MHGARRRGAQARRARGRSAGLGAGWSSIPEVVEVVVRRTTRIEAPRIFAGRAMRLPAFPDDRHRALVTDRLSRLGRARAGPEEAPCLPEPRAVPDLGERRGARLPIGQRQPAHVVLAIEGAAARRYATVVVHDGGVPEKQAREGLDVSHREAPLPLSVPLVADDPALL